MHIWRRKSARPVMGARPTWRSAMAGKQPRDMYGMAQMLDKYLEALAVRNYSEATTHGRRVYLNYFIGWAEERGITRPCEVTKPILERFQRYLFHHRKKNGDPLSVHSQTMYLA